MRLFLITFILFSCPLVSLAQQSALKISRLTDSAYVYTTQRLYAGNLFPSNGLYVLTAQGAVIIDAPWDTTQFQPLLDSIYARHQMQAVINIATHFHSDRTAGLQFFKEKNIKTYTSVKTDEFSLKKNEKRAEFLFLKDTVFNVGGTLVQTYHAGAGHSTDNIVVWFEKEKILYGGCLVKSVEATDLGNLGDANVKEWPATIKKIQKKFSNPEYVIPGHQAWTSTTALEYTLKLLKEKSNK